MAKKKMMRVAAMVSEADFKALSRLAEENERSLAAETRVAVTAHLKANGRRAA